MCIYAASLRFNFRRCVLDFGIDLSCLLALFWREAPIFTLLLFSARLKRRMDIIVSHHIGILG